MRYPLSVNPANADLLRHVPNAATGELCDPSIAAPAGVGRKIPKSPSARTPQL